MQIFECLTFGVTMGGGVSGGVGIGLGEVMIMSLHSLRLENITIGTIINNTNKKVHI